MNAVSNTDDFGQDTTDGSDSDTNNADELPEYYQPISNGDDEDVSDPANSNHNDSDFRRLPDGYADRVENGVSSIDMSDEEEEEEEEGKNDEGEEEEEAASESEGVRASRENESRRNAPLPAEAAARVMEAMRGVSFAGSTPVWANRVPEDQWINQLRGLRNNS